MVFPNTDTKANYIISAAEAQERRIKILNTGGTARDLTKKKN
jgi:hypothetical protein